jgi:hypothetical protein
MGNPTLGEREFLPHPGGKEHNCNIGGSCFYAKEILWYSVGLSTQTRRRTFYCFDMISIASEKLGELVSDQSGNQKLISFP